MKKKILIVGGTGFLGAHLAKKLCKIYSITSISLNKNINKKINNINYKKLDITKKKKFKILDKSFFDIVINLGGYVDHYNKNLNYQNQYLAVKNLIEYFENRNLKCFIQIGSSAEYGFTKSPQSENFPCNPKLEYGKAKLKATKYLQNIGKKKKIPIIILRLYQVFGPQQSENRFIPILINKCLNNDKFSCHSNEVYRDFLYIDDFTNLIKKILISKKNKKFFGRIFNVGFGKPLSLKLISDKIKKLCRGGSLSLKFIKLRIDENKIIYPDINLVKKVFRWKPKVEFDVGLKKTIRYYKTRQSKLK
jgi:nucleoside-diphosphate-sugar epimerase